MNKYSMLLMFLFILSLPLIMNFKTGNPTVNNSKSNLLMTLNIESNDAIIRFLDDKTGMGIIKDCKVILNNIDTANFIYKAKVNNLTRMLTINRLLI